MKKIVLLIGLICFLSFGFGTTYNTITLGTGLTDWSSDEKFGTSTSEKYNYITWDDNKLYFGFDGVSITDNEGWNQSLFIILDTDPQYTINSGNGSTNLGYEQWERGSTVNVPFNADYIFAVKAVSSSPAIIVYVYNNSSSEWDKNPTGAPSISVDWSNSNFEASILLSEIGNPNDIYVTTYAKDLSSNNGWGWMYSILDAGSTDGNNDKTITKWRAYTLTDGVSPNNTGSDTPLPITLASFSAAALKGCVSVTWVTESETENAAFRIYRDGEVIAQIAGAGTSTEPHSYAYTDRYVVPGRTYTYQLADVSFDGGETKHNEVEVELKAEGVDRDYTIGAAYPNPFNPLTVVPVNLTKDAVVTATLYDLSGRPLTELHNGTLSAGSHAITIDGANLSTGIYFVRVRVNDATHVQKIALMK